VPSGAASKWLWFFGRIFRVSPTALPFSALNDENTLELSRSYLVRETRMAGLQSGEGRMMIDSVVWAEIHQRDRQTNIQKDSHVAIANDAPTHCVGRQIVIITTATHCVGCHYGNTALESQTRVLLRSPLQPLVKSYPVFKIYALFQVLQPRHSPRS